MLVENDQILFRKNYSFLPEKCSLFGHFFENPWFLDFCYPSQSKPLVLRSQGSRFSHIFASLFRHRPRTPLFPLFGRFLTPPGLPLGPLWASWGHPFFGTLFREAPGPSKSTQNGVCPEPAAPLPRYPPPPPRTFGIEAGTSQLDPLWAQNAIP